VATKKGDERNTISNLTNYFLHGLVLFVISYVVSSVQLSPYYWAWSNLLVANVIGIVWLLVIMGILNTVIAESLWSLNVRSDGANSIAQGFLITLPTQLLILPFYTVSQILASSYSLASMVSFTVLLAVYIMIFGFIGRSAAGRFVEMTSKEITAKQRAQPLMGTRARCPNCGESLRYSNQDISDERTVRCHNCKQVFPIEPTQELLKKATEMRDDETRINL
jgi:predicted Zn finger-like uncharacterized protein